MNRFIGLIIMVGAIAALIGAALGWQFPFTGGRNTSSQRLGTRQTTVQSTRLGQAQPRNRRTTQPSVASAPNTTAPSDATNSQEEPADTSVKSPLW